MFNIIRKLLTMRGERIQYIRWLIKQRFKRNHYVKVR